MRSHLFPLSLQIFGLMPNTVIKATVQLSANSSGTVDLKLTLEEHTVVVEHDWGRTHYSMLDVTESVTLGDAGGC